MRRLLHPSPASPPYNKNGSQTFRHIDIQTHQGEWARDRVRVSVRELGRSGLVRNKVPESKFPRVCLDVPQSIRRLTSAILASNFITSVMMGRDIASLSQPNKRAVSIM
jgi:hypothetical protein